MKSLNAQDIIEKYIDIDHYRFRKSPILVLGAGASMFSLPSANQLKEAIIDSLLNKADISDENFKQTIVKKLKSEYFTLEVLGSLVRYFAGNFFKPDDLWKKMTEQADTNKTSKYISFLKNEELIGPIITINFDDFAYRDLKTKPEVVTEKNCLKNHLLNNKCLIPIHGTVIGLLNGENNLTPPATAVSRGFTKPFSPFYYDYIKRILLDSERAVIFIGISGNDHYDLNLLLKEIADKELKERCVWFSHKGDGSDLSNFVRTYFKECIYDCKAEEIFKNICDLFNLGIKEEINENKTVRYKTDINKHFENLTKETADDILNAIDNNTVAAWIAFEHYLLFSSGYTEDYSTNMIGKDTIYFSIDLSKYMLAHERYWADNKTYNTIESVIDLQKDHFNKSRKLYNELLTNCDESLKICKSTTDKAMIHVIKASIYDYLGLMNLQHVLKLESIIPNVNKYRDNSLKSFQECIKESNLAKDILENSKNIQTDFIPHKIWRMIGEENSARIESKATRSKKLKEVALKREKCINDETKKETNDYLLGHYPQCILRWCEYVKALLDCSGNDDIPNKITTEEESNKALEGLNHAYKWLLTFKRISSQTNHREAVFIDAKVCYLLSINAIKEAESLIGQFEKQVKSTEPEKKLKIIKNTKKRISKMKSNIH